MLREREEAGFYTADQVLSPFSLNLPIASQHKLCFPEEASFYHDNTFWTATEMEKLIIPKHFQNLASSSSNHTLKKTEESSR